MTRFTKPRIGRVSRDETGSGPVVMVSNPAAFARRPDPGGLVQTEDLRDAMVALLASPRGRFVTGTAIALDGGKSRAY